MLVGNNPASEIYVNNKIKSCAKVNITSIVERMDESSTQEQVENKVKELAENKDVNGILVQLPLPKGLDQEKIISLIPEHKDVDGLTKENAANRGIFCISFFKVASCDFEAYNSSTASALRFCTMCSWRIGVLLPM